MIPKILFASALVDFNGTKPRQPWADARDTIANRIKDARIRRFILEQFEKSSEASNAALERLAHAT